MGLGRDIAVLGVRLEASQAISEAAKLDRALDKNAASAAKLEGALGGASNGATTAGSNADVAKKKMIATAAALGVATAAAAVATVAFKVVGAAIGKSIEESERASAAMDRLTGASDGLYEVAGNALAPGLERLADVFEDIALNTDVVKFFDALGTAVGNAFGMVAESLDNATLGVRVFLSAMRDIENAPLAVRLLGGVTGLTSAAGMVNGIIDAGSVQQPGAKKQSPKEIAAARKAMDDLRRLMEQDRKERERAAKEAEREADARLAANRSLIDSYDRYGSQLRKFAADEAQLLNLEKDGALGASAALRELARARGEALIDRAGKGTLELIPLDTQKAINDVLDDQLQKTQKIDRAYFNLIDRWGDALNLANSIGAAIGTWNSELGSAIGAAAQLAEQLYAISQQSSMTATQGAAAGLGVGMAVGGMGQQYGLWQGDRGKSKFGGKKSGDYGDVGAAVGGVIGGIVGTMFLPGVGTAIGAAIGAVIGGVIGGAIKKGAQEGLAQITSASGQAAIEIRKDEGGLGGVAGEIGDSILDSVRDISTAIGGSLQGIPEIGIKIRDDVVSIFVNGIVGRFEEVGDAISFAVTEALKTSAISGLDSMFAAALKGTSADSLEQLQTDLEAVRTVLGFGLGEVAMQARDSAAELDLLRQKMAELLHGSDELGRALEYLNTEELSRWQDMSDALTGRQKTRAEELKELKAKADIFDAEKALRILELEARMIDLQAKRDQVAAELELRRVELEANRGFLAAKGGLLEAEIGMNVQYADAMSKVTGASLANLDAQLKALGALIDGLKQIPDINGNVKLGNSGFGGIGKKLDKSNGELEAIRKLQAKLVLSEANPAGIGSRLEAARLEYERLMAKTEASGGKKPAEGLASAAELYLDLFSKAFGSTGGGYSALWGQINDAMSGILTKNGIAPVKSMPTIKEQQEGQAAAFAKTFKRDGGGNLLMFDSKNEKRLASMESIQTQTRNRIDTTNDLLGQLVANSSGTTYTAPNTTTSRQAVRRGA